MIGRQLMSSLQAGPDTSYVSVHNRGMQSNNWEKKSTLQAGPDTGYISVHIPEMQNNNVYYNNRGQFHYVLIYLHGAEMMGRELMSNI